MSKRLSWMAVGAAALAMSLSGGLAHATPVPGLVSVQLYGAPGANWPVSMSLGVAPAIVPGVTNPSVATILHPTAVPGFAQSHSFSVTTPTTVASLAIVADGAVGVTASIHIYRMRDTFAPGFGGYRIDNDVVDINTIGVNTDDSWLGGGQGLAFTFPGAGTRNVVELVLSPSAWVTLPVGLYVLEIWNHSDSPGNFNWYRGGGAATHRVYGSAATGASTVMQASPIVRNPTHGDGRPGSLAIYIPEPASLGLLALPGLLLARRRS